MSLADLTLTERADLDAMPTAVGAVGDILYPALHAAGPLTPEQVSAISEAAPELVLAIANVVRRRMPAQIREMCGEPTPRIYGELGPCEHCDDAATRAEEAAEVLDESDATLDAQLVEALMTRRALDEWAGPALIARFKEEMRDG